jgi:hypothetical protein
MKEPVCPFCNLVNGAPHHAQQACIDALQREIARTRQVLQRRMKQPIAGGVEPHLGQYRHSAPADGHRTSAPRLSLRCTIES